MKLSHPFLFWVVLSLALLGAAGCQAPDSPRPVSPPASSLNEVILGLPSASVSVPASLLRANTAPAAGARTVAAQVYDSSVDPGVFGRTMMDLLYNWLLDKTTADTSSMGSLFLGVLKDYVKSSGTALTTDAVFRLGVRTLPAGRTGPNGETSLDMGSLRIKKPSDTDTVLYWTVPFAVLPGLAYGGTFYVKLSLTTLDAAGNVEVVTRMGLRPNGVSGPLDSMLMPNYERVNTQNKGYFTYNFANDETNTFQQFRDADGRTRTFFNAAVHRTDDVYDLLYLMVGDGEGAGIDAYQKVTKQAGVVINAPVDRHKEFYDRDGRLLVQTVEVPGNTSFIYPLKTLARTGQTLVRQGSSFWFESDGNQTFNVGIDTDLAAAGLGFVDLGYISPKLDREFTVWAGGKTFVDHAVDLYRTTVPVTGLAAGPQIAALEGVLTAWLGQVNRLDLGGGDIISLPDPTSASQMGADLGLPLDPTDPGFPTL